MIVIIVLVAVGCAALFAAWYKERRRCVKMERDIYALRKSNKDLFTRIINIKYDVSSHCYARKGFGSGKGYTVYCLKGHRLDEVIIKTFASGDEDYDRMCAEELCDKIKEGI